METPGLPDLPSGGAGGWFKRKEGKLSILWTALIGGGLAMLAYKALPFLTELFNRLTSMFGALAAAIGMGIIVVILAVIVLDKSNWKKFWFFYRAINIWLTSIFVQMNPILVMKAYVVKLRDYFATLGREKQNVGGVAESIRSTMQENDESIEIFYGQLADAKSCLADQSARVEERDEASIILQDVPDKITLLEESNARLAVVRVRLERLDEFLGLIMRTCERAINRIEFTVKTREKEFESAKMGVRALRAAMACLRGNRDEKALYEEATEAWRSQTGRMVAEIKDLLEVSRSYTAAQKLSDRGAQRRALVMLERWEKRGKSVLVTEGEKAQFVTALRGVADEQARPSVHVQGTGRATRRSRYGDILDGKKK